MSLLAYAPISLRCVFDKRIHMGASIVWRIEVSESRGLPLEKKKKPCSVPVHVVTLESP